MSRIVVLQNEKSFVPSSHYSSKANYLCFCIHDTVIFLFFFSDLTATHQILTVLCVLIAQLTQNNTHTQQQQQQQQKKKKSIIINIEAANIIAWRKRK